MEREGTRRGILAIQEKAQKYGLKIKELTTDDSAMIQVKALLVTM